MIKRDKKRKKKNAEFFTPPGLANSMIDKVIKAGSTAFEDYTQRILEPSFGNGNILIEMIKRRLHYGISPLNTVSTIYGVELMPDNVKECKKRILELFKSIPGFKDYNKVVKILDVNLVCHDFLTWDSVNWCPNSI